jgi:Protein of unknown function (DUF3617)
MRRSLTLIALSLATLAVQAFPAGRWEMQVEFSQDGQRWRGMGKPIAHCEAATARSDWEADLRRHLAAQGCDASGVRVRGEQVDGVLRCPQGEVTLQGRIGERDYQVQGFADVEMQSQGQALGRARFHYRQSGRNVGACRGDESKAEAVR